MSATDVVLLVQVPPPPSVSVIVEPRQTELLPDIAAGIALIVTVTLPSAPQQPAEDLALK